MKILSAEQIRQWDAYTIGHEPIKSIDLMERAARSLFQWIIGTYDPGLSLAVVCGTGNNGGDGLAVARMLSEHGYMTDVFIIDPDKGGSDDFLSNKLRLPLKTIPIGTSGPMPDLSGYNLILDAIFGTGLSRPVSGIYANVIDAINSAGADVLAIDIPSGLFADKHSAGNPCVYAATTLSFQSPKLAFFMPENAEYVGEWHILDIGLDKNFPDSCDSKNFVITDELVSKILKRRKKFAHKGTYGHALVIAGSYGKFGAAVLSVRAALRTGAGLVTSYVASRGNDILQISAPEAMVLVDEGDTYLTGAPDLSAFDAIGIGPGIGTQPETIYALEEVLRRSEKPLVIDADALNLISENIHLADLIPANSILTPHPGEFRRLTGQWDNDFRRLEMQRELASRMKSIVVLKGAHTSVAFPDGSVFFNISGNPGMATGGSGDVLTGIITSLLAQGHTPEMATLTGVFLHGLAGDLAARDLSPTAMCAGDIIDHLPQAFAWFDV